MRSILAAVLLLAIALPARAAIEWHEWRDTGFQAAVDQAAREKRLVALVVTQPDWCPPCIRLNAKWLQNPEDREVSPLLAGAMMLEVLGYDPPGAALLERQGVRFQGTPSLLVFRPSVPGRRLGDAELLGSVVGAPADYAERLSVIVRGQDPVAGFEAKLRSERRTLERARLALELADLCVSRGDANGAIAALREVREAKRAASSLGPEEREELELLATDAEWKRAASIELRVNKDHATALQGIDAWLSRHGREARDPQDVGYARAWALAQLGRIEEAQEELLGAFARPGEEDLSTVGYFAMRVGHPVLLADAEARLRTALAGSPDDADLHGTLGRVLRAEGRRAQAVESFERAVELSEGDDRVVWQGQLDWCRDELAAEGRG